jgi:hypothetical protein
MELFSPLPRSQSASDTFSPLLHGGRNDWMRELSEEKSIFQCRYAWKGAKERVGNELLSLEREENEQRDRRRWREKKAVDGPSARRAQRGIPTPRMPLNHGERPIGIRWCTKINGRCPVERIPKRTQQTPTQETNNATRTWPRFSQSAVMGYL